MIKGIIFDVDGVITRSENIHFNAYKKLLEEYGFDLTHEGFDKWFLGKSIKGGITSFLKDNAFDINIDVFIRQKVDRTIDIFEKTVTFYQDTIDFIRKISQGNHKLRDVGEIKEKPILAMVSGLERVFFDVLMKHNEFDRLFAVTVSSTDYMKSKPDPESMLITLSKMGLMAHEVVGIEDSPSGIQALNAAGVFSIGITNTQKRENLSDALIIVDSLMSLL